MNFDLVAWVAALVLALVFAVAGVAKLRDPEGTRVAIAAFGLPEWATRPGAVFLPATELTIAVLLIVPASSLLGAIGASSVLVVFIAGIAWNLARGKRPDCHCFGQIHSTPVGGRTILRNLVLLGLASLPLLARGVSPSAALGETLSDAEGLTVTVAFAGILATSILSLVVYQLSNEVEDLKEQVLRGSSPPQALLPAGSAAPTFELATSDGRNVTLLDLTALDVPLLLIFTSASCGPCNELMPEIARWQAGYPHVFTVATVATGERAASIAKAEEHRLTNVLLDEQGAVSDAYGANATPSAVLLNEDGYVDTEMVGGPARIRQIVDSMVAAHARSLWHEATGEHLVTGITSEAASGSSGPGALP